MRRHASKLATLTIVLILLIGCSAKYPSELSDALDLAGDNRPQLVQVLDHYETMGDTLKYQAACFLIENMPGHSYVTYRLFDSSGTTVDLDPLSFENYDLLQSYADSLELVRGVIDYERTDKIADIETISADFLINHIDLAFAAWQNKPFAKQFEFEDFLRYVLPYRGSNEPLEEWRQYFLDKYDGIDTLLEDPSDPLAAASAINKDVRSWFGFDARYYFHPTDQGLTEMLNSGIGRCEDMTNITIFALRANGLPVTSDYTPHWANTGNNHAWNAILTPDGDVIPFMGAEADPGEYKLNHKAAKVYRKTYDVQKENLYFQDNKQEKMPRWLSGKNYLDVTSDYTDVCSIEIALTGDIPDSVNIAYICVFNSGEWRPIDWGFIESGSASFTNIGSGVAYLPALYLNEEVVPIGEPFILTDECDVRTLDRSGDNAQLSLRDVTRRKQVASTETVEQVRLEKNEQYILNQWNDGWQEIWRGATQDKPILVDSLESEALYWLVKEQSNREERIFTIDNGRQLFW
jgi:hypothetical protein